MFEKNNLILFSTNCPLQMRTSGSVSSKTQLRIIRTPPCRSIDPRGACVPPETHAGKGQRTLSSLSRRKFFLVQIKILPCGCEFIGKPAPTGHFINDDWEQSIISFGYKGSSNWFKMADFLLEGTFLNQR